MSLIDSSDAIGVPNVGLCGNVEGVFKRIWSVRSTFHTAILPKLNRAVNLPISRP